MLCEWSTKYHCLRENISYFQLYGIIIVVCSRQPVELETLSTAEGFPKVFHPSLSSCILRSCRLILSTPRSSFFFFFVQSPTSDMSVHQPQALCLNNFLPSLCLNSNYFHTWTEVRHYHPNAPFEWLRHMCVTVNCAVVRCLVSEKRRCCCIMGCLLSYRQPAELFIWLCNLAGWHSLGTPSLWLATWLVAQGYLARCA